MTRRRRVVATGLVALASVAVAVAPAGATSAPPYHDPNAAGRLALCDKAGHPLTHGTISDQPFVWSAVSSLAAPPGYRTGGTATLFAYQPRAQVAPGDWSGTLITSSTRFTNPAHPRAVATARDAPLEQFLGTYPAAWNGLVQLRLYLGAPGEPIYTGHYAAADLRVTGTTWAVVGAADTADCGAAGSGTSLEQLVGLANAPTTVALTTVAAANATTTATPPPTTGTPSTVVSASAHLAPARHQNLLARALIVVVTLGLCVAWIAYARRPRPVSTKRGD